MSDSILVERGGGVTWIKLNRPEVFNAFNEEMGLAFVETLRGLDDPAVRCVVITGEGKAFCAGEDLRALGSKYETGTAPDLGDILRRRYNPAISALTSLRKPVIAAINGVAAGAGVSLALACDFRVMAESAKLALAFSAVGLVPDSGGTWLLPRYLGAGRAMELAIKGMPVDSAKAKELGMVNEVVETERVLETAGAMAAELAQGPTVAYGLIKELIWQSFDSNLTSHLEKEADAQTTAGRSADHLEGVNAFTQKRKPSFGGR